jgi:hypothetical protein
MFKRLLFVLSIFLLIVCISFAFGKDKQKLETGKVEKISDGEFQYLEDGIMHRLHVNSSYGEMAAVIDTLFWYDLDPNNMNGALPYQFPGDTVICNFKLIPDPAYLLKIRGIYGQGGGLADFYIWQDGPNNGEYPGPTVLANVQWNVVGSTPGQETWEELDFTPTGNDTIYLPWNSDPDPANRPYFVIGYVSSGSDPVQGGGEPDIYYDYNNTYIPGGPRGHSWFSYNGATWYGIRYNGNSAWGQYYYEVVVNYYNGTSPFVNSMSQLNDTWKTSSFKSVAANLVDIDGTITSAMLYYQKNGDAAQTVNPTSTAGDMYYFDIPGSYAIGDSITYWVEVTDNDNKSVLGAKKYFKIFGPTYADAPILVVFNGLNSSESDLALFWDPLLTNVIVDSLGLKYEYWDIEEHNGIDESIVDYPSFKHALVFGFSVNSVPVADYVGTVWENFVVSGKNILVSSADYLFSQGYSDSVTFAAGDFINDIFGVGLAVSDPASGSTSLGDEVVIGVAGDPITNYWAGVPILFNYYAVLGGSNWSDYAEADPALSNAATIFTGVTSTAGNGTRNISSHGGAGVYLPFCFSAIADTTPTGDPVLQDAANSLLLRILEWFETVTSIDNNLSTPVSNYELKANYPNPFNPSTTIEYTLRERTQVSLVIYNTLGEKVRTLVNDVQAADNYQIRWDGRNEQGITVASGIYIYKLNAGDFVSARKMILMK